MRLSDLQHKDVVNIVDGRKMGNIIDVDVGQNGEIVNLIVEKRRFFLSFFSHNEVSVKWAQLEKIGDDVILIKILIWYILFLFFMV